MYLCMHKHMYEYVRLHIHMPAGACMSICIRTCTFACTSRCRFTCRCTCTCTGVCIWYVFCENACVIVYEHEYAQEVVHLRLPVQAFTCVSIHVCELTWVRHECKCAYTDRHAGPAESSWIHNRFASMFTAHHMFAGRLHMHMRLHGWPHVSCTQICIYLETATNAAHIHSYV